MYYIIMYVCMRWWLEPGVIIYGKVWIAIVILLMMYTARYLQFGVVLQ